MSLLDFKKKLGALKHYYTRYRSAEELKWLFSRQLDKLYGDTQGLSLEITQATPQSQIDTIALALVNRFLSEVDARTTVDTVKLSNAVQRASELPRHTIFLLAQQVRREQLGDQQVTDGACNSGPAGVDRRRPAQALLLRPARVCAEG